MSLLAGARELANGAGQICTPLHIFLAALPPYAQNYLGEPPKSYWENRVPVPVRQRWASELLPKLMPFTVGQQGLPPNNEYIAIERDAKARAPQVQRSEDALALALALLHPDVKQVIGRVDALMPMGMNAELLSGELGGGVVQPPPQVPALPYQTGPMPAVGVPPISGVFPVPENPDEKDVKLAQATLNDFMSRVEPSADDLAYRGLATVELNTFFTTLAQAARNRISPVCIGQPGTLINLVELVLAARLASGGGFKSLQEILNTFQGGLYKIDVASLLQRAGRQGTAKAATIVRVAKQTLVGKPEKAILMFDHLESLGADAKDLQDVRAEIAERGPLLSFGIYHVLSERDQNSEAQLGPDNIRLVPFDPYTPAQTKALIQDFFLGLWQNPRRSQNEGRTFTFAPNAFDDLMALEGGAWHDLTRKVLPGLVIDVTENALQTAIGGDEALRQTVSRALAAFETVRKEGQSQTATPYRSKYEPTLRKSEGEIKQLLDAMQRPKGGFLGMGGKVELFIDPAKPIRITSANIVAELVCPNMSEFHYPGFEPAALRQKVAQAEVRKQL